MEDDIMRFQFYVVFFFACPLFQIKLACIPYEQTWAKVVDFNNRISLKLQRCCAIQLSLCPHVFEAYVRRSFIFREGNLHSFSDQVIPLMECTTEFYIKIILYMLI